MKNQAIKNFIGIFSFFVFLVSVQVASAAYPDWDYQASYRSKPSAFTVLSLTADQVGNTTGNTQTTGYNPYSYGTNGSTTTTGNNGYQTQTTSYGSNGQPIVNNYYYPNPSTSSTKVATTTTTKSTTSTAKNNTSSSSTSNNAKLASASAFNSPTNNPNAYAGMNTGASGFSNTSGSNGFASTRSNNGLTALSLGGSGSFMPSSLWQWIIVILLILIIIVIIRIISRRDETHVVHH